MMFCQRRLASSELQMFQRNMRIAFKILTKWNARIWHRMETLTAHVDYIDAPSLDAMQWCDEVERRMAERAMGHRSWRDTFQNKPTNK
jgi:hypothetical protein